MNKFTKLGNSGDKTRTCFYLSYNMQNSQELVGKYKEIIKKMDYGTNNETSPGVSVSFINFC